MALFYAVEFMDGFKTALGQPNQKTGRLSIACRVYVFNTKIERDVFLTGCRSKCKAVCRSGIRQYKLGMSLTMFNEWLLHLES